MSSSWWFSNDSLSPTTTSRFFSPRHTYVQLVVWLVQNYVMLKVIGLYNNVLLISKFDENIKICHCLRMVNHLLYDTIFNQSNKNKRNYENFSKQARQWKACSAYTLYYVIVPKNQRELKKFRSTISKTLNTNKSSRNALWVADVIVMGSSGGLFVPRTTQVS